jgi:hypothetical protein
MATIKVIRKKEKLLGIARKFKIYVDDKKIGDLANGAEEEFELPAGKHKIYCIQDIFNTPFVYEFDLNDGDSKVLIASYKKVYKPIAFMAAGTVMSVIGSQILVHQMGLDKQLTVYLYVLFILILMFIMKMFKMFKIDISEA